MQTVHIPKQEYDQYGPYTTLFDMDGAEHYADFVTCPPTTTHMRNISSESGSTSSCTTVDGSLPLPTHPSIQGFKQRAGSPQGFVSLVSESHASTRRIHRHNPLGVTRGSRSHNLPTRTKRVIVASDDEDNSEEHNTPLRKGATEQERIEHKRRLNTLAARRSRRRRADELKELLETVDRLEKDCVKWRTRSVLLHGMLVKNGFNAPPLSD